MTLHVQTILQHIGDGLYIQSLVLVVRTCRYLTQSRADNTEITFDLAYYSGYLLGIREDVNTLGVGIITYTKRTLNTISKFSKKKGKQ